MKTHFKVTVMEMIDYEAAGDTSHVSISGGIATHSFDKIGEFKCDNMADVVKQITINYGTPFVFDDRLELQLSDNRTLSFYVERVTVTSIDNSKLVKTFPWLEVH